ncbi:DUF58 domain-containing protein [Sphingomonas oligoaromativorans]|uniref:DUF58 domain-containing protein n=1 Tax=Sphingomonas oligoaromativorans TaxID=575322 RepID=UPI001421A4CD|nr:DUF58 domain-containing protein [Sphingomonas oligoaromativorans]NIJ32853.1 uncharacterized protein (DUF58 family) [Sphingomonas oligoaromativorans]
MTPRAGLYPTARAVLLMAAGAPAALTIGIVWPHLWTLGFGWMLFVVLLLGLDMALAARQVTVTLNMPRSAPVGGTVELRLATDTPGSVQATVDIDDRLTPLDPLRPTLSRERPEARIPLEASRRGIASLSALWLRWKGPLGLVWKQRREPRDEAVLITPDTRPARERSQLFIRHAQAGETARREIGTGAEFQSLKPWIDGMDRRAIDWKQSARHAMLLAKDWQIERNNQIVLAIDAGRAMAEPVGGVPRIDRAVSAALLAAYVALKLDDRVGLFAYAEQPLAASAIGHGIAAFPAIQRLAAGIDYGTRETNHTLGLTRLAQRLDRRTLIVLFTEFTDPTSAELMVKACAPLLKRHLLMFLIHRDEELESLAAAEPLTPEDVTRAVAAQALLRERAIVAARLKRMGVHVVEASHEGGGSALVEAYLMLKRQRLL